MPTPFDSHVKELRDQVQGVPARVSRLGAELDRVPVCVLVTDDAGYYVAANDRACELTGYSRVELLQRSVADLTAPFESAVYDRLWDSFLRTEMQYGVYHLLRKDHSVVKVEYRAYANLAPGIHISFINAVS